MLLGVRPLAEGVRATKKDPNPKIQVFTLFAEDKPFGYIFLHVFDPSIEIIGAYLC